MIRPSQDVQNSRTLMLSLHQPSSDSARPEKDIVVWVKLFPIHLV